MMNAINKVREFSNQRDAEFSMRCINQATRGTKRREIRVVVEGPESNWFTMPLTEAIKAGFTYSWEN